MKRKLLLLIMTFLVASQIHGDVGTAFFLSLGQVSYSFNQFGTQNRLQFEGILSDQYMGLSLYLRNQAEFNLIFNRTAAELQIDGVKIQSKKDGFGLEAGKVINFHLQKKSKLGMSLELVTGIFAMAYFFKNNITLAATSKADGLPYQVGLYWTIRIKNHLGEKVSFDAGFKSLLPYKSNEFPNPQKRQIILLRSFVYIGLTF